MSRKPLTVADLHDQIGTPGPHPMLYCAACGAEYSANAGDYFMRRPSDPLICCSEPMRLVHKLTTYQDVTPEE